MLNQPKTGCYFYRITRLGRLIKNEVHCDCPKFAYKKKIHPIFENNNCSKSIGCENLKICGTSKSVKSCKITAHKNKDSTVEDVTCKCNKGYILNKKGKCKISKKYCGVKSDYRWKVNSDKSCRCPMIGGSDSHYKHPKTQVKALVGENCQSRQSEKKVAELCESSCNINTGFHGVKNGCDLMADKKKKSYYLRCNCAKLHSAVTSKSYELFDGIRCREDHREEIFTIDFCEKHCEKNVMPVLSCELKNGKSYSNRKSHVSRPVKKSDFNCKYEASARETTTVRNEITTTTNKFTSAEIIHTEMDASVSWNPPSECSSWYYSRTIKKFYKPEGCLSTNLLMTSDFCSTHFCSTEKCAFKTELPEKDDRNIYYFRSSDLKCIV